MTRSLSLSRAARLLLLPACAALLLACGGGGGGGGGPVNQPPVAAAVLKGEAVLQASTLFDTAGTGDADGSLALRSWDYGDGTSGSTDSHVYTRTGTFTAVYTVTDNLGATASKTVPVNVAKCSAAGTEASRLSPNQAVCVQTSQGEMVIEMFGTEAPVTTANFLRYVTEGFYAGTVVHRATGLLFEAGGFTSGLQPKPATHPAIALESNNGLKNWQFTVAMARDAAPDSATTRFYVNVVDNHQFDFNPAIGTPNGNAVFGQLISGTGVADAIATVAPGTSGGMTNVPAAEITIRSAVTMK
ncbi:peptidylprolyl isomerase [Ramlibacter sp. XY19]|uniref:peptidylprolyl isomerase n=1 Tax=Ramlibacter paludis TaxID=2908000 RepID=UPI0023DBCC08|nr:peptidylprolyl isomerase [Ramlibacter paludis]MCG2593805.1 peptidylprolyl isomerase [Ramlibacter paludis]